MRNALTVLVALFVAAPAGAAAATPEIHAHRGGSVLDGVPTFAENTMPAFRNAALVEHAVLELDAKLTRDGIPVVFHDPTLDRVTSCSGRIADRTLAQLADCPVDVLGSPGSIFGAVPASTPTPVPTLSSVLGFARRTGAGVNLEIKNQPGDEDFDATAAFASRVMGVVARAGLAPSRLIVQSFWPVNLEVARLRLPGVELSLLTLPQVNILGAPATALRDYRWISPSGVPGAADVSLAHALGRRIVPYTLDTPADVRAAAAAGVDALITDDPVMARRALAGG